MEILKRPNSEFKVLIETYEYGNIDDFIDVFNTIFTANPASVVRELGIINALIIENTKMYFYVKENMMESIQEIHATQSSDRRKVVNLINELKFAILAYKKSFEENAQEIDAIENLIINWKNLLEINKNFCMYLYTRRTDSLSIKGGKMLKVAKEILIENMSKLHVPLKTLYKNQEEAIDLLNTINKMIVHAQRINKEIK